MEAMLFHLVKPENPETFKGLAIEGKRRIPMRLNKPDVSSILIFYYELYSFI